MPIASHEAVGVLHCVPAFSLLYALFSVTGDESGLVPIVFCFPHYNDLVDCYVTTFVVSITQMENARFYSYNISAQTGRASTKDVYFLSD